MCEIHAAGDVLARDARIFPGRVRRARVTYCAEGALRFQGHATPRRRFLAQLRNVLETPRRRGSSRGITSLVASRRPDALLTL